MHSCEKYMCFVCSSVSVHVKIPLDGNATISGSDGAAAAASPDGFIRFALEGGADLDLLPFLLTPLDDGLGVLVCFLSLFFLDVDVILEGFPFFCSFCFFGMEFECFPLCTASS